MRDLKELIETVSAGEQKRKTRVKKGECPKAVRKTIVDFCKKNKISVREFTENARKTKLKDNKDEVRMQIHYNMWKQQGWI